MEWEDLYIYVGGYSLLASLIIWPVFLFYSIRRIEKGIVAEGKLRPCLWDPIGGRAFFYTWTVTFPTRFFSQLDDHLLNTADVRRYTKPQDRVIGAILFFTSHTFILNLLIGMAFGVNHDQP